MAKLIRLLAEPTVRPRLLGFVLAAIAAVAVGFVLVPPRVAEVLIIQAGYGYILGVFVLFAYFGVRVLRMAWSAAPTDGRVARWAAVALAGAIVFSAWADQFKHKILFDEYVLQGTAWHMHATKEIGAPIRAYDVAGTWLAIDTFLDKRPYFFTFLVSLVHDATGFRLENAYALNLAFAGVCLGLIYWLAHALTGRRGPAFLAVALVMTMPLFGQNATGAGMEMHNLAMILVVMASAVLYLRAPDDDRLSVLVLGTVLLAQSRYESVLFVGPVAIVIALGWLRGERILLPWPAMLAPLLLVPYAWHDRVVDTKTVLWQLREGETTRFAWRYLAGNLEGAWNFYFSTSPGQPNSLWLTLVGLAGLAWAAIRGVAWWRRRADVRPAFPPAFAVLAWGGAAVAANVGLLMFYYWSRFDEPIAARFALPSCVWLAFAGAWAVQALEQRRLPALRIAAFGLAAWFLVFATRAYSRRIYTTQNMVMRELEWEIERVTARPGPVLLITQKATMPYLLRHISAINTASARFRTTQIAWHLKQGTFREVLVAQVVRPTTPEGDAGIDPDDVLSDEFHLEPIAQKRFGGRWIRLSRLVELTPVAGTPVSPGQ